MTTLRQEKSILKRSKQSSDLSSAEKTTTEMEKSVSAVEDSDDAFVVKRGRRGRKQRQKLADEKIE